MQTEAKILRWTKEEMELVARNFVARFPRDTKITSKTLTEAQDGIAHERRKSEIKHFLKLTLKARIEELITTGMAMRQVKDEAEETTDRVHNGHYDRTINGESLIAPAPIPVASTTPIAPSPQPALPIIWPQMERSLVTEGPETALAILAEINRLVLHLETITTGELRATMKDSLSVGRLRNLVIQASNGLSFFEELLSRH